MNELHKYYVQVFYSIQRQIYIELKDRTADNR